MTSEEQCGETLDGQQCELRIGHVPETHVVGRAGSPERRSWLLGREHEVSVPDSELEWADGHPEVETAAPLDVLTRREGDLPATGYAGT